MSKQPSSMSINFAPTAPDWLAASRLLRCYKSLERSWTNG